MLLALVLLMVIGAGLILTSSRRVKNKSFLNSIPLSKTTFLDLGWRDNQVLLNIWQIPALVLSVISAISNQSMARFTNVIAITIVSLPFWSVTV